MSFFPEPADAVHQDRQPAWAAAPDDVVPGIVPIDLVLGRSDDAVVVLMWGLGFADGRKVTQRGSPATGAPARPARRRARLDARPPHAEPQGRPHHRLPRR